MRENPQSLFYFKSLLECHLSIGFTPYVGRNLFQFVSLAYAFCFHDIAVKRLNRYHNNKYTIYYIIL